MIYLDKKTKELASVFIRKTTSPDMVERFDNVLELIVDKKHKIIYISYRDGDRTVSMSMNSILSVEVN